MDMKTSDLNKELIRIENERFTTLDPDKLDELRIREVKVRKEIANQNAPRSYGKPKIYKK